MRKDSIATLEQVNVKPRMSLENVAQMMMDV
jgi:hypothetical protein